ncbi:hypothetical protein KQI42_19950 [Tissierella sp. MSJ-40]|uniref:Uncharacterized protein n=1 Tax=Tissierella simiarum TaxID=2841534 RepID=A0ABS6ECL8_9FIRM|nr:hypothetical protein [Tissierella simiarum]MBU5440271.1 hypothetical protein [Tissierella simiarum]
MEKFYIAEEGSRLRKDYLEYIENSEQVRKVVNKFFKEFGITAEAYYVNNKSLFIVATKEDKEKFKEQLCKPKDELSRFKANSKTTKEWLKTLKSNNLNILSRPSVPLYFNRWYGGRLSSRLFEIEGVVYCSFCAEQEFSPKDKLKEIKASEFFKIIEDYNESLKKEG